MDPFQVAMAAGATSLAFKASKKYLGQTDHQLGTAITALASFGVSWFFDLAKTQTFDRLWTFLPYLLILLTLYLVWSVCSLSSWWKGLFSKGQPSSKKAASRTMNSMVKITRVVHYALKHPEYFPTITSYSDASALAQPLFAVTSSTIKNYISYLQALSYPTLNKVHLIDDPSFQGTMIWTLSYKRMDAEIGTSKTAPIDLPSFNLRLEGPSSKALEDFLLKISNTQKQDLFSKNQGLTCIPSNGHSGGFYSHIHKLPPLAPLSGETLAKHEFDTFFHPRRAEILMMIVSVHYRRDELVKNGLSTSLGIIAHGPPGSGKSLLGYKAARATQRFPLSLDLSKITTMRQAYQIIYRPYVQEMNLSCEETVILLDEFEEVVEKIAKEDRIYSMPGPSSPQPRIVMKPSSSKDGEEEEEDEFEEEEEVDFKKIGSTFKSHMALKKEMQERLTINGLLKLLQGPLPNNGAMIFATTNFIEKIIRVREALVRHGRLTPIHFDYPDQLVIDQMSQHYFDQPFGETIPKLTSTPISELTSIVGSIKNQVSLTKKEQAALFHQEVMKRVGLYGST